MNNRGDLTKITCTSTEFGVLGSEIIKHGKSIRFKAMGTSMHPLVRDGDVLLISPLRDGLVRIGEIVLCTTKRDQLLVHRVIRRRANNEGECYLIQGDKVSFSDGWIQRKSIHGRLVQIEREGKSLIMTGFPARFLGLLVIIERRLGLQRSWIAAIISGLFKRTRWLAVYLQ